MCLVIQKIVVLQNNWRISRKTNENPVQIQFFKITYTSFGNYFIFYFKEFYFSFRIYVNKNFITLLPNQKMYSDIFRNANRLNKNLKTLENSFVFSRKTDTSKSKSNSCLEPFDCLKDLLQFSRKQRDYPLTADEDLSSGNNRQSCFVCDSIAFSEGMASLSRIYV